MVIISKVDSTIYRYVSPFSLFFLFQILEHTLLTKAVRRIDTDIVNWFIKNGAKAVNSKGGVRQKHRLYMLERVRREFERQIFMAVQSFFADEQNAARSYELCPFFSCCLFMVESLFWLILSSKKCISMRAELKTILKGCQIRG